MATVRYIVHFELDRSHDVGGLYFMLDVTTNIIPRSGEVVIFAELGDGAEADTIAYFPREDCVEVELRHSIDWTEMSPDAMKRDIEKIFSTGWRVHINTNRNNLPVGVAELLAVLEARESDFI